MSVSTISDKEEKLPAQSSRAYWLKQARQWHLYLGTFFAPSILFFALTGALQLFSLHEGHPGEAYQPPALLVKLGSLHKKQTWAEKRGGPPPGFVAGPMKRPQGEPKRGGNEGGRESMPTVILKWFFLGASVGLVVSTLLGIYMAFKFNRSRLLIWGLLVGGTAIPAALVMLMVAASA